MAKKSTKVSLKKKKSFSLKLKGEPGKTAKVAVKPRTTGPQDK